MEIIQKPILKWVGGKSKLLKHIIPLIPKEINNYHEIFVGGGSVLFAILSLQKENKLKINGNIYAYDANERLIVLYNHIKERHTSLSFHIKKYIDIFEKIEGTIINRKPNTDDEAKTSKESYYYWLRKKFNSVDKSTITSSALFIILNKLCFRGVYRIGPNGFNVPYGHYKITPKMPQKEELKKISLLIKNVTFKHLDFSKSINCVNVGDFVYLDPPYAPETNTSFVKYTKYGFTLEHHLSLFKHVQDLNKKNIKFIMSNSNVSLVREQFKLYKIIELTRQNAIHSKNPGLKAKEVLIYN